MLKERKTKKVKTKKIEKEMEPKQVSVVACNGFIGSHIVNCLLEKGHHVKGWFKKEGEERGEETGV